MNGAYINGKLVKEVRCWKCGSHFYSNRSDAMFCSEHCRLAYYKGTRPRMRDIKCFDCSNRSDRHGKCELWNGFKGKTHPRNCMLVKSKGCKDRTGE